MYFLYVHTKHTFLHLTLFYVRDNRKILLDNVQDNIGHYTFMKVFMYHILTL